MTPALASDLEGYHRSMHSANPTAMQLACLIESVNRTTDRAAAEALGISIQTIKNHMSELYARIGAQSRAHAVALLWPVIGDELLPDVRRIAWRLA